MRLGEADRIVTLLTPGRGKVRAVAKGVRKTKSKFGARLEPTSHVALLLYEGRELDIVTQAESVEQFRVIREDLDRLGRATSLLEAVDQLAQERQSSPRLYEMLVGALRALSARDAPLLVPAFFLKVLALAGYHPVLDGCASCASPGPLVAFEQVGNLGKRRGFVFQSSEIYGGFRSTYDYGPLGVLLKRNVMDAWWRSMVQERDDIVGLDAAVLMAPKVWEASGHVATFTDPLVDCRNCKERWRADQIGDVCPNCGSHDLTEARPFHLMFKTHVGPVEDDA